MRLSSSEYIRPRLSSSKARQHISRPHRHRLERLHKAETAQRAAADAQPSDHFGLIPDPDLAHLDPHFQFLGQVLDQLPKIDPAIGRIEKDALFLVEEVPDRHEFHGQIPGFDSLEAEPVGSLLFFPQPSELSHVLLGGPADDPDRPLPPLGGMADLAGDINNTGNIAPQVRVHEIDIALPDFLVCLDSAQNLARAFRDKTNYFRHHLFLP
jgi:hypothetical protein